MYKKLAGSLVIGIALIASPILVSAQTTSTSNASIIATLEQLVVTLTQELQQLIAARATPIPQATIGPSAVPIPQAIVGTSPVPTPLPFFCGTYANLNKGDTDATTNGAVSALQLSLGMSNVTGYYGAQTLIAYQNKCDDLGNAQPTSVPGMSEYRGADFTFWYPSSWNIVQTGSVSMNLVDSSGKTMMNVGEVTPPTGAIGNVIDANDSESYYFDSNSGVWTYSRTTSGQTKNSSADMSQTTIGGLHMFTFDGLAYDDIIPLSATRFVTVDDTSETIDVRPLARTVGAINPAVAIPVSTGQQIAAIGAEATAYGIQSTNTSSQSSPLQTYTNSQYGFSIQYPNTLTINPPCNDDTSPESCASPNLISFKAVAPQGANGFAYGYVIVPEPSVVGRCASDPGNGIGKYSNETINGIHFGVYGTGGIAAGTQESITTYSTEHNGLCYSITEDEYDHYSGGVYANSQAKIDLESIAKTFRFTQ